MTLTTTFAARTPRAAVRLDYSLLRRAFFALAMLLLAVAPFSTDPIAFAAGAIVPWLVLRIVGIATLPAAVVYFLIYQWLQIFARTLISMIDGEEMARGVYGPWVAEAYWYMLASIIVLAIAFRAVLTTARLPNPSLATAHLEWRPVDLFQAYLASLLIAYAAHFVSVAVSALTQPMEALGRIKIVALFVLFANVLSSGKGMRFLAIATMIEIAFGFTGMQSEFRSVFVVLFMAAIAVRVRWTGMTTVIAGVLLLLPALFWTAVKADFRHFATRSDDSQFIKVGLNDRFEYLGNRLIGLSEIDWNWASYALVARLAYVDIFGSVIGVKQVSPERANFRQWSDALSHVFQPRILFPDKVSLSDIEVYIRLARGDLTEEMRSGTSISVGYLAENYVDFDFPGMLGAVFIIGLIAAALCRYFVGLPLPSVLREGIVMALVWSMAGTGVEISLPKLFGAAFMFFVVFAVLAKFAFPVVLRWLDSQAAAAQRQEKLHRQIRAARQP